jgi:hypothetical protein
MQFYKKYILTRKHAKMTNCNVIIVVGCLTTDACAGFCLLICLTDSN